LIQLLAAALLGDFFALGLEALVLGEDLADRLEDFDEGGVFVFGEGVLIFSSFFFLFRTLAVSPLPFDEDSFSSSPLSELERSALQSSLSAESPSRFSSCGYLKTVFERNSRLERRTGFYLQEPSNFGVDHHVFRRGQGSCRADLKRLGLLMAQS
jgi:hypothetical protein